jgi:REP element-mobilizing transposase RayT
MVPTIAEDSFRRRTVAQTLTSCLVHFIFSTKHRTPILTPEIEPALFAYMGGITRALDSALLAANGVADHVHLLISMDKKCSMSEMMENVKKDSSKWIKTQGREFDGFHWQDGYAGFSIGKSMQPAVERYIAKQKSHHRRVGFKEELIAFLEKYGVDYDERYIWE